MEDNLTTPVKRREDIQKEIFEFISRRCTIFPKSVENIKGECLSFIDSKIDEILEIVSANQ